MYLPLITNSITYKSIYVEYIRHSIIDSYCGYIPQDQLHADTTEQDEEPYLRTTFKRGADGRKIDEKKEDE